LQAFSEWLLIKTLSVICAFAERLVNTNNNAVIRKEILVFIIMNFQVKCKYSNFIIKKRPKKSGRLKI
jgi:hypothetical protein